MAQADEQENSPQMKSRSYQLPVEDTAFLLRDEMRALRFALEYAKADLLLRDWGIRSTVIVFGSARVPSPEQAAGLRQAGKAPEEARGPAAAARQARHLDWYQAAREFGRIVSERGGALAPDHRWRDNVIATGGGPGIMEAANRGAREAGAPTVGFNITLPDEQHPNAYTTPELTFRFHYFAMRKMHLAMRANALAIFPGGFGTLDELFEIVTLRQTRKSPPIPIVLFDQAYWTRVIDFGALVDEGMIAPEHLQLFGFAETAEEAWELLVRQGLRAHRAE
ncbi:MAG TPA: LOG family protein [Rubrivivax sp.]|nr:LOG family protein [Rubrivivax sp.]